MNREKGPSEEGPEIIAEKRHSRLFRLRMGWRVFNAVARPKKQAAALAAFGDSLSGTYPLDPASPVLLAACNDLYYRKFAVTLLLSLERQCEPLQFHLHLCSPSPAIVRHVKTLALALKHVSLSWTSDDGALASQLRYRSVYYASVRFLVAAVLLPRMTAPLLCIDVDGIAVRPVWQAYEKKAQGDVVLIQRPDEKRTVNKVLASAAGFNQTPQGLRFVAALGRSLVAILGDQPSYHVDQITIFYLMRRLQKLGLLKVEAMPQSLADFEFSDDGVIWTAKSWRTKNSQLYLDAKAAIDAQFPELVPSGTDTQAPRGTETDIG